MDISLIVYFESVDADLVINELKFIPNCEIEEVNEDSGEIIVSVKDTSTIEEIEDIDYVIDVEIDY